MKHELITFKLTDEQRKICELHFLKANYFCRQGKKGLVLAQIYENGYVKSRFIENELAETLVDAQRKYYAKEEK